MLSSSNRISLLFLNYFLQHVPSQTVDYVTVPRARRRLECESIKTRLTIYGKRVKVDFWEIFFSFAIHSGWCVVPHPLTIFSFFLSFFFFLRHNLTNLGRVDVPWAGPTVHFLV
jgi:hypothetical protein